MIENNSFKHRLYLLQQQHYRKLHEILKDSFAFKNL